MTRSEGGSLTTWDVTNAQKSFGFVTTSYFDLGPIRPGLTFQAIQARGVTLTTTTMNTYDKFGGLFGGSGNNCDTFARRLYQDISG